MIKDKHLPHAIFLDIDGTLITPPKNIDLRSGELHERTIKAIKNASLAELENAKGVSKSDAKAIYEYFKKDN